MYRNPMSYFETVIRIIGAVYFILKITSRLSWFKMDNTDMSSNYVSALRMFTLLETVTTDAGQSY